MRNNILDLVLYIVCTTILILFICFNGYGQDGTVISVRLICAPNDLVSDSTQYDTIRVIMLVCDTAQKATEYFFEVVHWQYGYEVYTTEWVEARKITTDDGGIGILPAHNERILISRLDADKKPLSKNIIVWQSILIK